MGRMTGHQHTDDAFGSTRKLTYADFLRFPDDGRRHELVDGVHVVSPSPEVRHQQLSLRMTMALGGYLEAVPIGIVLYAPIDCVLTMFDIVEPDLLVVLDDQKKIVTKKNIRGMPAIVIEILSDGTRLLDQEIKRALYERALSSGWEGLIAKQAGSPYQSGKRTPDWRKLKIVHEQEFVIGGWTEPRHTRSYFGAKQSSSAYISFTPALVQASIISSACSSVIANGFSMITCLRASAAARTAR